MTEQSTTHQVGDGRVVRLLSPPIATRPILAGTMRLRRAEPLALGLQRMALDQLEVAHDGLARPPDSPDWDKGVHTARKAMKRARALLRLVRDHLGHDTYRNENAVLRDQARRLSGVRSARVLADTLDLLSKRDLGGLSPTVVDGLREQLRLRHRFEATAIRSDMDGLAAAKIAIGCARNRIATWPVLDVHTEDEASTNRRLPEGFASIEPGIRRVYRRGRRALVAARKEHTALAFHEWRKRVKYLRYQIEALQDCWPEVMEGLESSLNDLAETLGDEHDLADLARLVSREPALVASPMHRTQLQAAIDRRRRKLQAQALRLGALVYAEEPGQFTKRMDSYWQAWRPSFA